ncbi:MAG: DUF2480 family protein [Bacteroidetes bacterium]|nr:MAG: DUF2480 family protein [Bacteroidota bacterium]
MEPLVNRVAKSGLITIDLEQYFPKEEIAVFDLKDHLFQGLVLREKDFREAVKTHDWSQYRDKVLLVYCSADAIIPVWAFMLVASAAAPFARGVFQGSREEYLKFAFLKALESIDPEQYADKRIVIKGCSNKPVPPAAYAELTRKLQPVVKSIMYGEPCSTVPIFKKKVT